MSETISTQIPGLTLRFAIEDDVGVILDLILRLAEYEKLADQVVADEEILAASLFGDRRVAEVILAEIEGMPVGYALFFHNFSTFLGRPGIYLEDLFVVPEERSNGVGKTLLAYLATLAVERECGRIEWAVLDWNQPAIDFYENLGARGMDEWTVFRLTGDKLDDLASTF